MSTATANGVVTAIGPADMTAYREELKEAFNYLDCTLPLVVCEGKNPGGAMGRGWQVQHLDSDHASRLIDSAEHPAIGAKLGPGAAVDFDIDGSDELAAFADLFDGEPPVLAAYTSGREGGEHRLAAFDDRLAATGVATIKYVASSGKSLTVRIGCKKQKDGTLSGAQSIVPCSYHAKCEDGLLWEWTGKRYAWKPGLSLEDVGLVQLPDVVIEKLLAAHYKKHQSKTPPTGSNAVHASALASMRTTTAKQQDKGDGSNRLYTCACRTIEANLSDSQAIATIQAYAIERPFSKSWTEEDILQRVRDASKAVERGSGKKHKAPKVEPYRPFPLEKLPADLANYVSGSSKSIGCDDAFVALPCLAVCAGAIGNSRRVLLKRDWTEPAVLWAATIGESGAQKSPALDSAIRPLEKRQEKAFEEHAEAMTEYQEQKATYDREKKKKGGEPPLPPEQPTCERVLVNDTTVAGLVPILQDNPRGVLLARDELAGWLESFDKYGQGKGDSADWLSMHGARPVTVDRKAGDRPVLYVPRAAVSIVGTIQPGVLNRFLGTEHRESGLLARILVACPPRSQKRWIEREVPRKVEAVYIHILDDLSALAMEADDDGRLQPGLVRLSAEAKTIFAGFVNRHGEESSELAGDLAAAYSKLEATAARLALIFALIDEEDEVSGDTMTKTIAVVEWFKYETRRVYALFDEDEADREHRELIEWIDRKGGSVTARDLQSGNRRYRESGAAESALNDIAKAGTGEWKTVPTKGRPGREFHLFSLPTSTEAAGSAVLSTCVDADNVDRSHTDNSKRGV